MQYIKIYENWFWNKKTREEELDDIEKVQDEPIISEEELDEFLKLYKKQKEKFNFYNDLYDSGHKKYFDKLIIQLNIISKMLYKLSKMENFNTFENFKKDLHNIGSNYTRFSIGKGLEKSLSLMFDTTFYLNRINRKINNINNKKDDIYYTELIGAQYRFRNKEEVEKKKEEHKDIDPFGEEEWKQ